MKRFIRRGFPASNGGIIQGLEKVATKSSSLWKVIVCVVVCAAAGARGQEAVSPLELLRQSRAQVAVTNFEYALALAKAAVTADPAFAEGWKLQGRIEMLRGKPALAAGAFDTVMTLRPDDPDIPIWYLWVGLELGYVRDTGTKLMQRSDADLLKAGDALVARTAGALMTQNFSDDAVKLAGRWATVATNEDSRAASAVLELLARGENSAAVSALEKIGRGSPSAKELLANAWLRVGRVRAKAGDAAGAKVAFTKALEIIPGWSSAEKELNPPVVPPVVPPKR